jgi:quinol monooxygenase YgiN
MVIVEGIMEVDPSRRDEFLQGRRDAIAAARAEQGCVEYAFSADAVEPGRVRIFERWESQADLDAHLAGRGQAPAPPAGAPAITSAELRVYQIAGMSPLAL